MFAAIEIARLKKIATAIDAIIIEISEHFLEIKLKNKQDEKAATVMTVTVARFRKCFFHKRQRIPCLTIKYLSTVTKHKVVDDNSTRKTASET